MQHLITLYKGGVQEEGMWAPVCVCVPESLHACAVHLGSMQLCKLVYIFMHMFACAENNQMELSRNALSYASKQSSSPALYANSVWFDCMQNKQQVFGNEL